MNNLDLYIKLGKEDDYLGWSDKIPYINFPEGWMVKMCPPFHGSMARFLVQEGELIGTRKHVSVLLDCHQRFTPHKEQYWEVFPLEGEYESNHCDIYDVDKLLIMISKSIEELKTEKD